MVVNTIDCGGITVYYRDGFPPNDVWTLQYGYKYEGKCNAFIPAKAQEALDVFLKTYKKAGAKIEKIKDWDLVLLIRTFKQENKAETGKVNWEPT